MKFGKEQTIFGGVWHRKKHRRKPPKTNKPTNPSNSSWWKKGTSLFSAFCPIFCKIYELEQQTAETQIQEGINWDEYSEKSKRFPCLLD